MKMLFPQLQITMSSNFERFKGKGFDTFSSVLFHESIPSLFWLFKYWFSHWSTRFDIIDRLPFHGFSFSTFIIIGWAISRITSNRIQPHGHAREFRTILKMFEFFKHFVHTHKLLGTDSLGVGNQNKNSKGFYFNISIKFDTNAQFGSSIFEWEWSKTIRQINYTISRYFDVGMNRIARI